MALMTAQKKKLGITIVALFITCYGISGKGDSIQLERDREGWTVIPSDALTVHGIADSDDQNGDGTPSGPVSGFRGGFIALPDGGPQHILMLDSSTPYIGESAFLATDGTKNAPHIITSQYGSPCAILDDVSLSAHMGGGNSDGVNDLALINLCFISSRKDPNSGNYVSNSSNTESKLSIVANTNRLLLEALNLRFTRFAIQAIGSDIVRDMTIRRSVITDNYSASSHAQGFFSRASDGVLFEENIMDHNGWATQQLSSGNDKEDGQATVFNHNLYLDQVNDWLITGNLFLRPSSIQNKFTANSPGKDDEVRSENVTIENNFYFDGEVMISAGGNTDRDTGPRFRNYKIANNVFAEAGTSRPTGRYLAWGIEAQDWQGGEISGNIITNFKSGNAWYLVVSGHTSDVSIAENVVYHKDGSRRNGAALVQFRGDNLRNISFSRNLVQAVNPDQVLISISDDSGSPLLFRDNIYFSLSDKPFSIGGKRLSFEEWRNATGDNSKFVRLNFFDPDRTFAEFNEIHNYSNNQTFDHIRTLDKTTFLRSHLRAREINKYFKEGFKVVKQRRLNTVYSP